MTRIIAVTGKGGTGKTAITTLLIRHLTKGNKVVLAVDADPDTNLPETLGCKVHRTIGDVKEFMHEERENLPPDVNKQSILESKIYEIIEELPGYDLLVMGRPEGAGCYCYVNNLLRGIMNKLVGNYDVLIIDAEAGLEHFSRKIFRQINDLLVVTDGSRRGLGTAERIRELVEELETDVDHIYVIANKVTDSTRETISSTAAELGLELIGMVPLDEMIVQRDLAGQSLMELPEDSPAVKEIENISRKLNL